MPTQVIGVLAKKRLDVVAVQRQAAVEAEVGADRPRASEAPEANCAARRPRSEATPPRRKANAQREYSPNTRAEPRRQRTHPRVSRRLSRCRGLQPRASRKSKSRAVSSGCTTVRRSMSGSVA